MSNTKLCPYCGEEIKSGAIKCKHCGSILSGLSWDINETEAEIQMALDDKYEIINVLGKGGMATVYKAIQKNLNRLVALKVVHKNLIHDAEFLQRFHREAQTAASLNHPNIVKIYDEGNMNGVHFIAMEYLEGMDLHEIIQNDGPISVERIIKYIAPIAASLDYVHRKGLVHRDVKTANIFITDDERPVLTDFGIAHASVGTKLTQSGSVIGTPEYMSPEQAEGHKIDGRSDLFGLGIVMYECIVGKVPFMGDNPLTTIHGIIYDTTPAIKSPVDKVPGWLESLIRKTLEKSPDNRIPTGNVISVCLSEHKTPSTTFIKKHLKESPDQQGKFYRTGSDSKQKILISLISIFSLVIIASLVAYVMNNGSINISKSEKDSIGNNVDSKVFEIDAESLLMKAEAYINNEQYDLALQQLEAAYKVDSNDLSLPGRISYVENKINELEGARKINKLLDEAEKKFKRNNLRGARNDYNKILEQDPGNKKATEQITVINQKMDELARNISNKKFTVNVDIADSLFNKDRFREAIQYYQEAAKLRPADQYVKDQIAYTGDIIKDYEEEFQKIMEKAEIKISNREYQSALSLYMRAQKISPGNEKSSRKIDSIQALIDELIVKEVNNNLVFVKGGTFRMGSDQSAADEKPEHSVTIRDFYIDKYEVTVKQYQLFCEVTGRKMPSQPYSGKSGHMPVVNVSWNDAAAFAKWASKRLPTEAEWEYAAKGGNKSEGYRYSGSNSYSRIAVYSGNAASIQEPGSKESNELGIYDMSGNVWEWCYDKYDENYYSSAQNSINPTGPVRGKGNVIRGGAYDSETRDLQTKNRSYHSGSPINNLGFRCVKVK